MPYKNQSDRTKWDNNNTVRVGLKLTRSTDADIIDVLDKQPSKQGFIKKSIRHYIAEGCPETEKTDNGDESD